mgnify:CR=1 FL=1|tara:strand:+ start:19 stop:471 length:453 start_codon:yes stop_codon:yes gene_type:complete
MKLALAALMMLTALPAYAGGPRVRYRDTGDYSNYKAYESQRGYAKEEKCYKNEYREEYVPGTSRSPGYVKSYKERVEVPCRRHNRHEDQHPNVGHTHGDVDDNSCVEGSILGGILGGGAGAAASRGDGRLWAIPLGIVSGAMVGCQIDGG